MYACLVLESSPCTLRHVLGCFELDPGEAVELFMGLRCISISHMRLFPTEPEINIQAFYKRSYFI